MDLAFAILPPVYRGRGRRNFTEKYTGNSQNNTNSFRHHDVINNVTGVPFLVSEKIQVHYILKLFPLVCQADYDQIFKRRTFPNV
jgi:hypothetical protein